MNAAKAQPLSSAMVALLAGIDRAQSGSTRIAKVEGYIVVATTATASARALQRRGFIEEHPRVGLAFRVTEAGRRVLATHRRITGEEQAA